MEAGKVATKKRESFMSEDEETSYKRKERDEELLREQRNTLETDYINSEMKTFDLDDHEDFTRLFHMVEVDALNPDMSDEATLGRARECFACQKSERLQISPAVRTHNDKLVTFLNPLPSDARERRQ